MRTLVPMTHDNFLRMDSTYPPCSNSQSEPVIFRIPDWGKINRHMLGMLDSLGRVLKSDNIYAPFWLPKEKMSHFQLPTSDQFSSKRVNTVIYFFVTFLTSPIFGTHSPKMVIAAFVGAVIVRTLR